MSAHPYQIALGLSVSSPHTGRPPSNRIGAYQIELRRPPRRRAGVDSALEDGAAPAAAPQDAPRPAPAPLGNPIAPRARDSGKGFGGGKDAAAAAGGPARAPPRASAVAPVAPEGGALELVGGGVEGGVDDMRRERGSASGAAALPLHAATAAGAGAPSLLTVIAIGLMALTVLAPLVVWEHRQSPRGGVRGGLAPGSKTQGLSWWEELEQELEETSVESVDALLRPSLLSQRVDAGSTGSASARLLGERDQGGKATTGDVATATGEKHQPDPVIESWPTRVAAHALPMLREAATSALRKLGPKQDGCNMGLLRHNPQMPVPSSCTERERERLSRLREQDAVARGESKPAHGESKPEHGADSDKNATNKTMGHPFETVTEADRNRHLTRNGPFWDRLHLNHSTSSSSVFMALASFRDRECPRTLESAFKNAANASRVFIGIVQQTASGDQFAVPFDFDCLDMYCNKVGESNCRRSQVRVSRQRAEDSEGVCVTRYDSQQLLEDETFFLQVDSHSLFAQNWDSLLIDNWKLAGNPRGILTAYPMADDRMEKPWLDGISHYKMVPRICRLFLNGGSLANKGAGDENPWVGRPELTGFWAAGLSFGLGESERAVPYDKYMPYVFMGEEPARALRLYSHGFDFYIPSVNVVFHYYRREGAPRLESMHHAWQPQVQRRRAAAERRVWEIFSLPQKDSGEIELSGLAPGEAFAIGNERTRQQYLDRSGFVIHTPAGSNASKSQWIGTQCGCGWQLDPVPLKSLEPAAAAAAVERAEGFTTRERLLCCNIDKPGGAIHMQGDARWDDARLGNTAAWATEVDTCSANFVAPYGGEGLPEAHEHKGVAQGDVVSYPSWNGTTDDLAMRHLRVVRGHGEDAARASIKLLCVISTNVEGIRSGLATRSWRTWGKRCSGVLFVGQYATDAFKAERPAYAEAEAALQPFLVRGREFGKAKELFEVLRILNCRGHTKAFTHFLFMPDNSYVVVENVRKMIAQLESKAGDAQRALYTGRVMFEDALHRNKRDAEGVPLANSSTGALTVLNTMYLFNSAGLEKFADATAGWRGEGERVAEGQCNENMVPDIALSRCMQKDAHVTPTDSRDDQGRERFHGGSALKAALTPMRSAPDRVGWYAERSRGPLHDGLRALAPESVAFNGLSASEIEGYERALYGSCEGPSDAIGAGSIGVGDKAGGAESAT